MEPLGLQGCFLHFRGLSNVSRQIKLTDADLLIGAEENKFVVVWLPGVLCLIVKEACRDREGGLLPCEIHSRGLLID